MQLPTLITVPNKPHGAAKLVVAGFRSCHEPRSEKVWAILELKIGRSHYTVYVASTRGFVVLCRSLLSILHGLHENSAGQGPD
jgi:hypothetical protein